MTDLDRAIAAAREALKVKSHPLDSRVTKTLRDLLAALDAVRGEAVAWQAKLKIGGCERWTEWGEVDDIEHFKRFHDERGNAYEVRALYAAPPAATVIDRISDERLRAIHREEQFGLFCDYEEFVSIARHLEALLTRQAPPSAVPEEGLRDSVLNSAKFRASCYALVGIVEGIEGLGRNWAANGERLKDTREWVAFYNCVASMRNGTAEPTSATQAPPAAVVSPEGVLSAVERAISKGYCPLAIEEAYEQYEAECIAMLTAANKENGNG